MNTKMILTDLDHTLLRSDGSISEYTKQILKMKEAIQRTPCRAQNPG